jgi:hypothetical protein
MTTNGSTTTGGPILEHAIGTEGLLVVRVRDGSVRLRGIDGETVLVRERGDGALDDTFDIERSASSLSLSTGRGFRFAAGRRGGGGTTDVTIEVPRGATVVVEAASADIEADGLIGDQRYRTASGDIGLRAVTGRISLDAVSGDIDATATGEATIEARSVSGDLAIRAARLGALAAGTTSGDVKVAGELAGDGPFSVETVSGDVLLALAGGARIEATTVAGDFHSEVPYRSEGGRGRRSYVVGDGRSTLSFRSMSGDLRVVAASPMPRPAIGTPTRPATPAVPGTPTPPVPPATPAMPAMPARPVGPAMPPLPTGIDLSGTDPAADATPALEVNPAIVAAYDEARLRILRSLERGEIDVDEASSRLESLDGGETGEHVR